MGSRPAWMANGCSVKPFEGKRGRNVLGRPSAGRCDGWYHV